MIALRRASERHYDQRRKQEIWLTFDRRNRADPFADGFGNLESLSEKRLPPGTSALRHPHHNAETVTYVREGALAYEDSTGRSGVLLAGEFQCLTSGRGIQRSETNASRTNGLQVFQVELSSSGAELESGEEQKRFSTAERRGELCVIASPDARRGSLPIHQDALMYSALLDAGQHVIHEISQGRSVWLHLVQGEATFANFVLTTGDGVGVRAESAMSLTAREETEILLFDLGEQSQRSGKKKVRDS